MRYWTSRNSPIRPRTSLYKFPKSGKLWVCGFTTGALTEGDERAVDGLYSHVLFLQLIRHDLTQVKRSRSSRIPRFQRFPQISKNSLQLFYNGQQFCTSKMLKIFLKYFFRYRKQEQFQNMIVKFDE